MKKGNDNYGTEFNFLADVKIFEHGTYMYCNDMGCELPDRLISLLGSYADSGFDYDITCEQVFESCGLDIYSISIAAVIYEEGKKPEVETILFTAKCY